MPVLKSLSFTAMPKTASDPVHMRRAKFIEKLEEQKLLLQDPAYIRTVQRMAEVDGVKQAVVRKQRVKPWWKTDPSGQVVMSVKFGAKPIEFEKGKAGIAVPSKDKFPTASGRSSKRFAPVNSMTCLRRPAKPVARSSPRRRCNWDRAGAIPPSFPNPWNVHAFSGGNPYGRPLRRPAVIETASRIPN